MISSPQLIQTMRQFMDIAVHYSMRASAHFTKAMGLSMPQFSLLMQLYYRGVCGMSEVSERFEITPAAASQLVDKLVQSGLIHREEDPHDRRAKSLNLTTKGKELIQRGIEDRYSWVEPLAEKLTTEERTKVNIALSILTEAARAMEAASLQHTA
ncbi:MAG TPA: MarR family transcriptional regulator [Anaerolineales bacterium]|nr:MarR family transcriptional regulator [Anaerolineales bacterium]